MLALNIRPKKYPKKKEKTIETKQLTISNNKSKVENFFGEYENATSYSNHIGRFVSKTDPV